MYKTAVINQGQVLNKELIMNSLANKNFASKFIQRKIQIQLKLYALLQ